MYCYKNSSKILAKIGIYSSNSVEMKQKVEFHAVFFILTFKNVCKNFV